MIELRVQDELGDETGIGGIEDVATGRRRTSNVAKGLRGMAAWHT
jgi:hypothetical protein